MKIRIANKKDNLDIKRFSKMGSGPSCKRHHKRHISKVEQRYRIVENTMRGYFNYSI